jgi:hypothetical protein
MNSQLPHLLNGLSIYQSGSLCYTPHSRHDCASSMLSTIDYGSEPHVGNNCHAMSLFIAELSLLALLIENNFGLFVIHFLPSYFLPSFS